MGVKQHATCVYREGWPQADHRTFLALRTVPAGASVFGSTFFDESTSVNKYATPVPVPRNLFQGIHSTRDVLKDNVCKLVAYRQVHRYASGILNYTSTTRGNSQACLQTSSHTYSIQLS